MSKRNKVNPGQYTQAGRLSPDDAARELRTTQSAATPAPHEPDRSEDIENEQTSGKSGSRSSAQKAADSKYVDRPHPASEKVEGAFGRESGGSSKR
jgi:hypothetical protein